MAMLRKRLHDVSVRSGGTWYSGLIKFQCDGINQSLGVQSKMALRRFGNELGPGDLNLVLRLVIRISYLLPLESPHHHHGLNALLECIGSAQRLHIISHTSECATASFPASSLQHHPDLILLLHRSSTSKKRWQPQPWRLCATTHRNWAQTKAYGLSCQFTQTSPRPSTTKQSPGRRRPRPLGLLLPLSQSLPHP